MWKKMKKNYIKVFFYTAILLFTMKKNYSMSLGRRFFKACTSKISLYITGAQLSYMSLSRGYEFINSDYYKEESIDMIKITFKNVVDDAYKKGIITREEYQNFYDLNLTASVNERMFRYKAFKITEKIKNKIKIQEFLKKFLKTDEI